MRRLVIIAAFVLGLTIPAAAQRQKVNIDFDWNFRKDGEIQWRRVDVPHDFSIEGPYSESNPATLQMGYLPGGIGWYTRTIAWDPAWEGKRVSIVFDGVFMNSTLWVNGQQVGFRPNGYLTLRYDITSFLKTGDNEIKVKVDNSLQPAARWYTGSGIYRPVNLIITDPVHVAHDGTHVWTVDVSAASAEVKVEVMLCNETGSPASIVVKNIVRDPAGETLSKTSMETLAAPGSCCVETTQTVKTPSLWSPDAPAMYSLVTEVYRDGVLVDDYHTPLGFRTLEFSAEDGFKLNGEKMLIKGICMHQDDEPAGIAVYPDMLRRRLKILKEMGCNAIRTTHHAFSPEFYDLCDEMGFLVMDELFDGWFQWKGNGKAAYDYGYYFLDWWEQDLTEFIKRDRNHPCIFMWSMGNEVWKWENHQYLQWKINDIFHKLDPTRPTTQAWALGEYLDVAGFNMNGEGRGDIEKFHQSQPSKVSIGTEIPHTRATRGVYKTIGAVRPWIAPETIKEKEQPGYYPIDSYSEEEVFPEFDARYASGYDNQPRKATCREEWKQVLRYPYFIGEFRWTAFDYLGESWGNGSRTNNYGVIDLACFPKDPYYLYQSLWTQAPMVHILPHWTWPGKEGKEIPVVAWTNCDEVELFLNGKSLGRKSMDEEALQILWQVRYTPGTLKAVGYRNGVKVAQDVHYTASKPAAIRLTVDRKVMKANRKDIVFLTVDILDKSSHFCPSAACGINFEVSGPYTLVGVENGDILDWNPQQSLSSKTFMGKTLLVLKATGEGGQIRVKATSPGLKSATINIDVL